MSTNFCLLLLLPFMKLSSYLLTSAIEHFSFLTFQPPKTDVFPYNVNDPLYSLTLLFWLQDLWHISCTYNHISSNGFLELTTICLLISPHSRLYHTQLLISFSRVSLCLSSRISHSGFHPPAISNNQLSSINSFTTF